MSVASVSSEQPDFVEVVRPLEQQSDVVLSTYIDALVVTVEPQACSALVKTLSTALPLASSTAENGSVDLSHLKRVKRTDLSLQCNDEERSLDTSKNVAQSVDAQQHDESREIEATSPGLDSSSRKRRRAGTKGDGAVQLDVLLGSVSVLEARFGRSSLSDERINLSQMAQQIRIPLDNVRTIKVPSRLAESEEEWKVLNAVWPMIYLPNKTKEFIETEMKLNDEDVAMMRRGMHAAVDDVRQFRQQYRVDPSLHRVGAVYGVAVMCPQTRRVVATANSERLLQTPPLQGDAAFANPLSTPYTLAIQAISRIERQVATTSIGGMQSEAFQNGQYLCTGYDVYGTLEPSIYEAMALVHTRIRRLTFGCARHELGLSNGGVSGAHVHALPWTNHHYRSFSCRQSSDVWQECRESVGLPLPLDTSCEATS